MKQRIELTDSTVSVVAKMSEGNPGAMNVLCEILKNPDADQTPFGGLGFILLLDSFGIYGTDIYILHNDICGCDLSKTMAVLKATQSGYFDSNILKDACHRQDRSGAKLVPVDELVEKLKN